MKTYVAIWGFGLLSLILYSNAQPQHSHSRSSHGAAATRSYFPISATATSTPTASHSTYSNSNSSASNTTSSSSGAGSNLGLPPTCYRPNGVPMGWLPDGIDILTLQNSVDPAHGPCTYGNYAHITSTTNMNEPDSEMAAQALPSSLHGAVYNLALQPFIPFSQVSASAVAASLSKVLARAPPQTTIWLRLAHEVNWYIDTNPLNTNTGIKYHGTTSEFKAMWQAVANAVDRSRVRMFWSPVGPFKAGDSVDTLNEEWFPGAEFVDIVGLDAYGQSGTTFEKAMRAFCDKYPGVPVALGETGWLGGGTKEQKEFWLREVSSADTLRVCPDYVGFSWFEYDKPGDGDYRIVTGPDGDIAKEVLQGATAAETAN